MLCCVGLFAGAMIGGALGIPWLPYITIPLGGGAGLLADIKIFRTLEKKNESKEEQLQKEPAMNPMCCGSIFNLLNKKKKQVPVSEN